MSPETPITVTAAQRFIAISIEKVIKLHEAGHTNEAIAQFADILTLCPDNDEIIFKLAGLYKLANRIEESIAILKRVPAHSPFYCDAMYMLGKMLGDKRDFAGGAECLIRLLEIDSSRVEVFMHLARFLMELGLPDEAQKYLLQAIHISPDHADSYLYLGNLFARYWRVSEAREQFQRVITLQPDNANAYNNLSGIAVQEGNIAEAISLLSTALKLQPKFTIAADNLLFDLNYSDSHSPEQVRELHFSLADIYSPPELKPAIQHRLPSEKIRVGYVSGDFRSHSVAFFLEPVLTHHNREQFDIFCYDMVTVPDETTHRMMNLGWTWRPIYGLSDREVVDQIKADGIDILVDLSGHSLGNRLGVFALSPAPSQVTWLGYPNTTGLKQINFRLTDELADPTGMTDHLYSETLVRLPRCFLCYSPPASAPKLAPLPEGPLTFCCFNNHPKISPTTLHLWASVLHALPESKLLLKNGALGNPYIRNLLLDRFAVLGIDRSRLIIEKFSINREEHLQRYSSCHIALDTYPYNGTTTTCEALWMGVPVISLAGTTHAARVGASILKNSDLPELVAQTADQFVEIAVALANSPKRIQVYRNSLRERLLHAPITDASSFTADLEQAYSWMLEGSCNHSSPHQ